jgi:2-oxo-4-hydroxy-4-carboxy-5-ureidoimidazoline decarboxylase
VNQPDATPASGLAGLTRLNTVPAEVAHAWLLQVCAAPGWVEQVLAGRPYRDLDSLQARAAQALAQLSEDDLHTALAGHRRIGEGPGQGEQTGVDAGDRQLLAALQAGNRAYEARFGHVYLVCAAGRSGPELLELLHQRLGNDPQTEAQVVREELGRINALRLQALAVGESQPPLDTEPAPHSAAVGE